MEFGLDHLIDPRLREFVEESRAFYVQRVAGRGPGSREELDAIRATAIAPTPSDSPAAVEVACAGGCFLDDGQLLRDAHRLAGIPGIMVHGRYDVSGPLDVAWQLAKAWSDGELTVIGDAGHSGGGMTSVLIEYLDRVALQS